MTGLRPVGRRSALFGSLVIGVAACAPMPPTNRFVVFYTNRSVELEPAAVTVVRDAEAAAKATPNVPVIVSGYADLPGSPEAAEQLSARRAQTVAERLVASGIDRGRIVVRPRGTGGGEPGLESRRVEIIVGG